VTSLPWAPPAVAVQLGSLAVIWLAMLLAICAAVRLPCAHGYVAVPIWTQCV